MTTTVSFGKITKKPYHGGNCIKIFFEHVVITVDLRANRTSYEFDTPEAAWDFAMEQGEPGVDPSNFNRVVLLNEFGIY